MSIYVQVALEIRSAASLAKFNEIMKVVIPIAKEQGWKLRGAYSHTTGRLYTIIDIWELKDYNHYEQGSTAIYHHPRFPEISAVYEDTVERETVTFMQLAPYFDG